MKPPFRTISVVGLGYVGLPTAAVFASRGLNVVGVDVNERTVDLINQGKVHIVEPDLDILVRGAVAAGRLRASTRTVAADAFIVAVPTPFTDGHKPDLSYLKDATAALAPVLKRGDLVVIESTSPVGTSEQVCSWLAEQRHDLSFPHSAGEDADVQVAHSPERVLPGRVLLELVSNDRVVGGVSRRCAERAAELYGLVISGKCLTTTARTAELVKLAENAFRDVNIAFANELSLVCERFGIDVWEAIALANHHPRVDILKPGPGVGGHCIAVDPWFIIDAAPDATPLMRTARAVNDSKPGQVVELVRKAALQRKAAGIACLGLAYKADIDDLRESPAVEIVRELAHGPGLGNGTRVLAVEPHIQTLPETLRNLPRLRLVSLDEALTQAQVIVLLADHRAFKAIDRARLKDKTVIDTRGAWR
ncbi:MAG: UDP-N-acetyl-D-mannosamine dehydrogenase [Rhodospirillales bacterium]|nr:UDP-N-acetyl-D-mannosamine dehydrogenase [Rhodospirillales bacterium]